MEDPQKLLLLNDILSNEIQLTNHQGVEYVDYQSPFFFWHMRDISHPKILDHMEREEQNTYDDIAWYFNTDIQTMLGSLPPECFHISISPKNIISFNPFVVLKYNLAYFSNISVYFDSYLDRYIFHPHNEKNEGMPITKQEHSSGRVKITAMSINYYSKLSIKKDNSSFLTKHYLRGLNIPYEEVFPSEKRVIHGMIEPCDYGFSISHTNPPKIRKKYGNRSIQKEDS